MLVLEAAGDIGGAARTEEFAPGFRVSSIAHLLNRLHPDVVTTLELEKHGLQLARSAFVPSVALSTDGPPLVLHGAYGEVLTGASSTGQTAWKELRAQLLRYAGILKPLLARRPPDLGGMSLLETAALGQTALALKKLGKEDMRDFLRVLLMNVADLLDEQLSDDRLKGLLAFDATLGSHLGPRSPTSLLGLYYRLAGEIRRRCRRANPAERRHGRGHFSHLRGSGEGRRDHPHQCTGRPGSSSRKAAPSASRWPAARKSGRGRSFPPSIRQPRFSILSGRARSTPALSER